MKTIDQLREEVDMIDAKILDLLSERIEIVKEIAIQKNQTKKSVFDKKREEQIRKRWCLKAESIGLENKLIQRILTEILKLSKETQRSMK